MMDVWSAAHQGMGMSPAGYGPTVQTPIAGPSSAVNISVNGPAGGAMGGSGSMGAGGDNQTAAMGTAMLLFAVVGGAVIIYWATRRVQGSR